MSVMSERALAGLLAVLLVLPLGQALTVELFSKPECNPCDNAREYLNLLQFRLQDVELIEYNQSQAGGSDFEHFNRTASRLGITTAFVPVVVVGEDSHMGYVSDKVDGKRLKDMISANLQAEKHAEEQEARASQEPEARQEENATAQGSVASAPSLLYIILAAAAVAIIVAGAFYHLRIKREDKEAEDES